MSTPPHVDRLREPTMADVARAAGVSRALVSIVMRDAPGASTAMRSHVKATADALGYRANTAAQVLRRARSRNVGVLFSPRFPFEVEIVEAMYPAADACGYRVVLGAMTGARDLDRAVDELVGHRCEAVVLVGLDRPDEWFAQLRGRLALVRVGRVPSDAHVDVVRSDERRGVRAALQHLADLGHRRIAFVGGGDMPGAAERAAACRNGMRKLGLGDHLLLLPGDYTDESGASAARTLLSSNSDVTAVLAANDWSAVGLVAEFARRGVRVPHDLSVVGYDDSDLARRSYVDLTSVGQDPSALAAEAIGAVQHRLEQPDAPPLDAVVAPRLVVRSSTAAPRRRRSLTSG